MPQIPLPLTNDDVEKLAPGLADYTERVLFGDLWKRPGLSARDRSLVTVTALITANQTEQLPFHVNRALDNGVTRDEITEIITHLAFYAGWPKAMSATRALRDIFAQRDATNTDK